jgi:hypothetical protein
MRRASSNIGSNLFSYVVDGVLCSKRRLLLTMTPTSLGMCGGAEASLIIRQERLFGGYVKLLERHSEEV